MIKVYSNLVNIKKNKESVNKTNSNILDKKYKLLDLL